MPGGRPHGGCNGEHDEPEGVAGGRLCSTKRVRFTSSLLVPMEQVNICIGLLEESLRLAEG